MADVRFLSPRDPSLVLRGVPAAFVDGVFDIPAEDTAALARMRYLGSPHGVVEIGVVSRPYPWFTAFEIAQQIGDPDSEIGGALRLYFQTKAP